MRIGIDARFTDAPNKTGVAYYVTNLITSLAALDNGNEYVLYFNSLRRPPTAFPQPAQPNFSVRVLRIPFVNHHYFNIAWAFLLPRVLRRDRIDVAHLMPSAFPLSTPCSTVATIHDMTSYRYPHLQSNHMARFLLLKKMTERTIARATRIIADSHNTHDDIATFFPSAAAKTSVVYLGNNYKRVPLDTNQLQAVRSKHSLGDHFILFLGSLEKRKNVETLLAAFAILLAKNGVPHNLVIVGGDGTGSASIRRTIRDLGIAARVILTGYLPEYEVPSVYCMADVMVFPSVCEGFGLPCVEAMTLGVPVVASDIPVFREVLGDSGLYFPPMDSKALALILLSLLSDPQLRARMADAGTNRAARFTWEETARRTLDIYQTLPHGTLRPATLQHPSHRGA